MIGGYARTGRPHTSKTDGNIEKIRVIMRKNRCLSIEWLPEVRTVNQVYYKEVLTTLHKRVRRG